MSVGLTTLGMDFNLKARGAPIRVTLSNESCLENSSSEVSLINKKARL